MSSFRLCLRCVDAVHSRQLDVLEPQPSVSYFTNKSPHLKEAFRIFLRTQFSKDFVAKLFRTNIPSCLDPFFFPGGKMLLFFPPIWKKISPIKNQLLGLVLVETHQINSIEIPFEDFMLKSWVVWIFFFCGSGGSGWWLNQPIWKIWTSKLGIFAK